MCEYSVSDNVLCVLMLCLAAFLLLGSSQILWFSAGVLLMGVAHGVITVKGTHLASHGALSESQGWGKFWAVFFIEVTCSYQLTPEAKLIFELVIVLTCSSVEVPLSKTLQGNSSTFWEKHFLAFLLRL